MTSEPKPIAWIRPETADWFSSGQNGCKSEVSSIDLAIIERAPYTTPLYSQATIETFTRERDEAREALKKIRDGYGPNHMSEYARKVAAAALPKEPTP